MITQNVPLKPIIPPCKMQSDSDKDARNELDYILPNVKPSAGDTNLDPNTENAPETGYIADISPLEHMLI
jgi:hypothetical protein